LEPVGAYLGFLREYIESNALDTGIYARTAQNRRLR
jgi:hypothetical protein